jgi:hypothetical protein
MKDVFYVIRAEILQPVPVTLIVGGDEKGTQCLGPPGS